MWKCMAPSSSYTATHQFPIYLPFKKLIPKPSKEEKPAGSDSRKVYTAPSWSGTSLVTLPVSDPTDTQLKSKSDLIHTF